MKTKLFGIATALLFSVVATGTCQAQQTALSAQIPFAFQAGNTMLPAGEYQIRRGSLTTETVAQIRDTDSSSSAYVATYAVDPRNKHVEPKLIFNCYSNACFLSEIWTGSGKGRKLVQSNREKELSHARAENEMAVVSLPLTVTP